MTKTTQVPKPNLHLLFLVAIGKEILNTNIVISFYMCRTLALAATSQEEKDKWLEDLFQAINVARERNDGKILQYLSLKSSSMFADAPLLLEFHMIYFLGSSEEGIEVMGQDTLSRERSASQRSNTTVHVCWHRNTSTCLRDHVRARSNELSGFLLRKFKNSNGWQKLWVVFTHFCLFFYKKHSVSYLF